MIEIFIDKSGNNHNDLHLEVNSVGINLFVDSYYFAYDFNLDSDNHDYDKVVEVLTQLLNYWKHSVQKLGNGDICYLPFDFSDEYTGCFKVKRVDSFKLRVSYGYSNLEGWNVSPSNPEDYATTINDFEPVEVCRPFEITLDEFLECIDQNIAQL